MSGLIIDTSSAFASAAPFGPSGDQKYPLVKLAVDAFDGEKSPHAFPGRSLDSLRYYLVNMVVVVGHERLHVEMQRLFGTHVSPNPAVSVIKVPKSGGVRASTAFCCANLKLPSRYRSWNWTRAIANEYMLIS